jgi:hypothetical protein
VLVNVEAFPEQLLMASQTYLRTLHLLLQGLYLPVRVMVGVLLCPSTVLFALIIHGLRSRGLTVSFKRIGLILRVGEISTVEGITTF